MNALPLRPIPQPTLYFGKYRGLVLDNIDPLLLGRVTLQVPSILGETPSAWALPCVPSAGLASGFFVVPPVGSSVWVEFEGGRVESPIWTGGFWPASADVPPLANTPPAIPSGQNIIIQTTGQNMLLLSDAQATPDSGGIVLKSPSGASIVVNSTGIHMDTGGGASLSLVASVVSLTGTVNLPHP